MRGSANILTQEADAEMRAEMVCDLHADTIATYEVMSDAQPSYEYDGVLFNHDWDAAHVPAA
jgi:hypothetical protein